MKALFFIIWFPFSSALADIPQLAKMASQMLIDIKKAKECVPHKSGKNYLFCTGLLLKPTDIKQFNKMDLKACHNFIRKAGYKVSRDRHESLLSPEFRQEFFKSTKRAQVYYNEKVVLFKPSAKRVDCLHEVLHLYQRLRPSGQKMSPIARKQRELAFLSLLEREVSRVEKIEKAGDKALAKSQADKLGPLIKVLGKWRELINWLDEKEIYYFIYQNCQDISCTEEDRDIALTNLYRLRHYFSYKDQAWITKDASDLLKSKIKSVKDDVMSWDLSPFLAQLKTCSKLQTAPSCLNNVSHLSSKEKCFLKLVEKEYSDRVCEGFYPQSHFEKLFKDGKISRNKFEHLLLRSRYTRPYLEKVFLGNRLQKGMKLNLKDFKRYLLAESFFASGSKGGGYSFQGELSFREENDLPLVSSGDQRFILDLGAERSIYLPKAFYKRFPLLKGVEVIGQVQIRTADGATQKVPKVKLKNGQIWLVSELPISKMGPIAGLIGLDYFGASDFSLHLKSRKVVVAPLKQKKPSKSLLLRPNIMALEVLCPSGYIFRIDTGSQVRGDLSKKTRASLAKQLKSSQGAKCGAIRIKGPFHENLQNDVVFNRGVVLNLGWPWLKEFSKVDFSRTNNWVLFQ